MPKSALETNIDKATNGNNVNEDWGLLFKIVDQINQKNSEKEALRLITKKLNDKDPYVVKHTLKLLHTCVSNCGRNFINELKDFVLNKKITKLSTELAAMIEKWVSEKEFKSEPASNLLSTLYSELKVSVVNFKPEAESGKDKKSFNRRLSFMIALSKSNLPSPPVANECKKEEKDDSSHCTAKKNCNGSPNSSLSNDLTYKMSTSFNLTGIDDTFDCLKQLSFPKEDNYKTSSPNFSDNLDQLNQNSVEKAKRLGQAHLLNNYNENYMQLFVRPEETVSFSSSNPFDTPFDSSLENFGHIKNLEPSFSKFNQFDDFLDKLNQDEQLNRKEFADNELILVNQTSSNSSNASNSRKWWKNPYQTQPSDLEVTNNCGRWSNEKVSVKDFFMSKSEMPSYLLYKKSDVHLSDISRIDQNNNDQLKPNAAQIYDDITFSCNQDSTLSSSNFSFTLNSSDTGEFILPKPKS